MTITTFETYTNLTSNFNTNFSFITSLTKGDSIGAITGKSASANERAIKEALKGFQGWKHLITNIEHDAV